MASKGRSVSADPPTLADIQERIVLVRRLVALSLDFDAKARSNAELARTGLLELEGMLAREIQQ